MEMKTGIGGMTGRTEGIYGAASEAFVKRQIESVAKI